MRFIADENFNGDLLERLRKLLPELDIIRVQDTQMAGSPDPELLAWAAEIGCILLTHDIRTVAGYAYDRVRNGLPMPGVIEVRISQSIGITAEEIAIMIEASTPEEFENQVRFIPIQ